MKKPSASALFIIAAMLWFFAAMANAANRAVYITLGVVFMILSITRNRKSDETP